MTLKQQHLSGNSKVYVIDLVTPVAAYLKLRDLYPGSLCLESSEYNAIENSKSIIALNPIYEMKEHEGMLMTYLFHQQIASEKLSEHDIEKQCISFFNSVHAKAGSSSVNGFLGYQNFDLFAWAEGVKTTKKSEVNIPLIRYAVYEFVLVFDHFKKLLTIVHNKLGESSSRSVDDIYKIVLSAPLYEEAIRFGEEEKVDTGEQEYLRMVKEGKRHCQIGNVFQIVLSRHFSRSYQGDEFMLYRKLRSINPSPYLFYYDYIDYQLVGSSPEAQIVLEGNQAIMHPIAGTYIRTGNTDVDFINAQKLLQDKKENAEHVMLVDLARNDLSKFCEAVKVESYREIQMYSHVIHLVSKVVGTVRADIHPFSALLSVSPAGTLSGAPKHRALELIDSMEASARSFYGGSVGIINFNGNINQAITIRSCLLKDGQVHYRAGAGIVHASIPKHELQETYNKINAIRKCFDDALFN